MKLTATNLSIGLAICIFASSGGASNPAMALEPSLPIAERCREMVALYDAIPANETFVTALVHRESDDTVIGAACGKRQISLFRYDPRTSEVLLLDAVSALWWNDPVIALGPTGDIFLGAACVWDKQFTFERNRERPATPDAKYSRRGAVPDPSEVNENAKGMAIRHYAATGQLLGEYRLPESLSKDGAGALMATADGKNLIGLSAPGGHLFTIDLSQGEAADRGEVVPFATHQQIRRIGKAFMEGADGTVYFGGSRTDKRGEAQEDELMGLILAYDPATGKVSTLDAHLPAVTGRHRFAAIDAVVRLDDGSYLGGTNEGYLFRFDPRTEVLEAYGKPLRQQHILGLGQSTDGLVYGAGGESGGMPRLFAFDPVLRQLHLGMPPTGNTPAETRGTFGDLGALVTTRDGTLVCGEDERRGYLLVYRPRPRDLTWGEALYGEEEFADCARDRFIDLNADTKGFQLAPTYLISDVMSRSSKIEEDLSAGVHAEKQFNLHSRCRAVQILMYGGGGTEAMPMNVIVNKHRLKHIQDADVMLTGGWDRMTIPGEYLVVGKNQVEFSLSGWLTVDTDSPQGNSSKTMTGGDAWRSDILGPNHDLMGEYAVRFRVHGHPASGVVTSPPIDLAQLLTSTDNDEKLGVPPVTTIRDLRLRKVTDEPANTAVRFDVRSGSTPDYVPVKWSTWYPVAAIGDLRKQRFFQWRATLTSSDMNSTPRLESVSLEVGGELSGENRGRIEIVTPPDNAIAVSSYPFRYADPHHPRMRHLREKYHLDDVVSAGKTDLEKFALLRQWVREQWEGWDMGKYDYCPQWDALEVLELAPSYLGLGMCTHYAMVFVQCASSLGYNARSVILDHHCVAEAWSDEAGKWTLQDVGLIANVTTAMQFNRIDTQEPQNALEIHNRYLEGHADDVAVIGEPKMSSKEFWNRYLGLYSRFGIPFRNDHLHEPSPQELEHGQTEYHWDGYLWWTDSLDPKFPEYSYQTRRPEDFYWTLNKTLIDLQDTVLPGELSVRLHGPIPNLETFMIQDGADGWKECEREFAWKLRTGRNLLQAKAVNSMGIEGPVNTVEIQYAP